MAIAALAQRDELQHAADSRDCRPPELVQCGDRSITSFDPDTGKVVWTVDGPSQEFVATPFFDAASGLVFASSSWPERHLLAIRPNGEGNVSETHVAWRNKKGAPTFRRFWSLTIFC